MRHLPSLSPGPILRLTFVLFLLFSVSLAACTAFPTANPSNTPTATNPPASPTPTATLPPTIIPTAGPTQIPSPIPTPTLPPLDLGNVSQMVHLTQTGAGTLGQVAVSPDGQTLAVAGGEGIWLMDKFHLDVIAHVTGHAGKVTGVSWSPNGTRLVSGGEDQTVRVWDVAKILAGAKPAQVHLLIAHSKPVTAVSWSSNSTLIASAGEDGNVMIWELSTTQQGEDDARLLHQLAHATTVYALAWHPNGRYLAAASFDSTLDLWDTTLGLHLATLEGHESWATTVAWNLTGDILASGATDRTLRLWDVTFTTPSNPAAKPTVRVNPRTIIETPYNPNVVAWTPDNTQIVSAGGNPFTIHFWETTPTEDLEEPEPRQATLTLSGHFAPVNSLAFAPGGVLISTGADTTLRVWNQTNGQEIRYLSPQSSPSSSPFISSSPFTAPAQAVIWNPDGSHLASAHNDYTIRLWETNGTSLTQTLVLTGHQNIINSMDWSANGNWIATGSNDNTTRVWDTQTGHLLQTFNSEGGFVSAVAFAPFGNQLASGGLFRIVQIWEIGTDQPPILLTSNTEITELAWAPNGTLLAVGGNNGSITLWDVPAITQLLILSDEHNNPLSGIAWSPDGTRLATLDTGGKIVIWDTSNGLPLTENLINGTRRSALSWSPNSQLLATGNDTKLYLLNAETGEPLRVLVGHTGEIRSVEWKPDGGQLASIGLDGTLHLWATTPTDKNSEPVGVLTASNNLPTQPPIPSRPVGLPITLENAGQVQQLALLGHGTAIHLAANPNGNSLAVAGGIGTWIYDIATWEPLRLLPGNKTYGSIWSPNGKLLAVRELSSILVWDVEHEQVLRVFGVDVGVRPSIAWSPDGALLAAGNFRGSVRVFNLTTGEIVHEWQPGTDITNLVWSPDGRVLAAGGTAADSENGLIWLWDIPTGKPLNVLNGHTARVIHLAWSPNSTQLLSAGDDLALNLWDVSTLELPPEPAEGEEIEFTPLTNQTLTADEITGIVSLAWNADSSLFMTGDTSGGIYFWGAESGLIQSSLAISQTTVSALWLADEEVISLGSNGEINQWVLSGEMTNALTTHSAEDRIVQWGGENAQIYIGAVDGTLKQVGLDGSVLQTRVLGYIPTGIAYFSNTGLTAVRDQEGAVEVVQMASDAEGRQISQGSGEINTDWLVDWSEDGDFLAWNQIRDEIPLVEVVGLSTNEQVSLAGAEARITALAWSTDLPAGEGNTRGSKDIFRVSAGTEDGKVFIWDVASGNLLRTIQAYSGRVRAIAWSSDGKTFATGGSDGQDNDGYQYIRLWDANTGRMVRELELPFAHEAQSLVWAPDGTVLASGDSFGYVLLWNPANGDLIGTLQGHTQAVVTLDWSRVSNAIVSGSRDGTVRVWGIAVSSEE